MNKQIEIIINVGSNPETLRYLEILEDWIELLKEEDKKEEMSYKLENLKQDILSTVDLTTTPGKKRKNISSLKKS